MFNCVAELTIVFGLTTLFHRFIITRPFLHKLTPPFNAPPNTFNICMVLYYGSCVDVKIRLNEQRSNKSLVHHVTEWISSHSSSGQSTEHVTVLSHIIESAHPFVCFVFVFILTIETERFMRKAGIISYQAHHIRKHELSETIAVSTHMITLLLVSSVRELTVSCWLFAIYLGI